MVPPLWRAVVLPIAVVACARSTGIGQYLGRRLATAPSAGPTCYGGNLELRATVPEWLVGANERRWLVLDPTPADEPEGYAVAYLMAPEGHNLPIFGQWRRVGDSVEVQETNTFPPAYWKLADRGDTLVGRGVMIHDVVDRDSAGQIVERRSEWPARADRVSCRTVP